jgi:hypothetical protein
MCPTHDTMTPKDIDCYAAGQIRSTSVCPVIPAGPVPDPDPGAGIHRAQGPNFLNIALHGDWIPVSQPE